MFKNTKKSLLDRIVPPKKTSKKKYAVAGLVVAGLAAAVGAANSAVKKENA
jgi:hypothetical protein